MSRTLIVGYDGSENGADALALGAVLAECLAATPLVVTAMPEYAHLLGSSKLEAEVERHSKPIFAAARARLGDVKAETRAIIDTSPGRALNELAEGVDSVVLVIGSGHRGPVGRILLGTTGAALLSGAPCAIAVAPRGYAQTGSRRVLRIGAAVNGADESDAALAAASGLAARLHASLRVLGVVEAVRLSHGGEYPAADPATYERASEQAMDRALRGAMDTLPAELPAERRLMSGNPAELLAAAAEELDLLVLGSRGYGPVRRALLGSVSSRLIESAPCPVLVLPRAAGADPLGLTEPNAAASPAE